MYACLFLPGATCPLPWLLEHGTIKPLGQLYFCGTTVTFSCDEGYRLNGTGANSSLCTRNGTWTEDFPTCESIGIITIILRASYWSTVAIARAL